VCPTSSLESRSMRFDELLEDGVGAWAAVGAPVAGGMLTGIVMRAGGKRESWFAVGLVWAGALTEYTLMLS